MLDKDTLKINLPELTDEQAVKIAELSKNDEDSVIGARIGEIYRQFDDGIKKGSGVERKGNEKTYNYLSRAFEEMEKSKGELTSQIETLTKERDNLKAGGDVALKSAQEELEKTKGLYSDLQKDYNKQKDDFEARLKDYRLDGDMKGAAAGLKIKPEIPEEAAKIIFRNAVEKVKSMKPEYKEDGTLVFNDEKGVILDREDGLKPMTAEKMLRSELKKLGVLDEGKKKTGTGGEGNAQKTGEFSACRTQVEFDEAAREYLLKKGIPEATSKFQEEWAKLRKDYEVSKLPLR